MVILSLIKREEQNAIFSGENIRNKKIFNSLMSVYEFFKILKKFFYRTHPGDCVWKFTFQKITENVMIFCSVSKKRFYLKFFLTHFSLMFQFYTSRKRQKTKDLQGVQKWNSGLKWVKLWSHKGSSKNTSRRGLVTLNWFSQVILLPTLRSTYQRCSMKKSVLRNFPKFTGKLLYQSLCFNKVAGLTSYIYNH